MTGAIGATALVLNDNSIELVAQASRALGNRSADEVASDESYWRDIQNAFTLDRSLINLNNGNSCPSPTVVHEAYKRYLDYSNQAPVYHRGLIERNIEVVRRRLADQFGCDPEEMAITRNSSESLQIAQNGIDLAWLEWTTNRTIWTIDRFLHLPQRVILLPPRIYPSQQRPDALETMTLK